MPIVSTDDSAKRLRNTWLGPKGWRLPDARFVAWGVFITLTALFAVIIVLAMPTLRLDIAMPIIFAPLLAVLVTRRVMVYVEYDTPVRYYRRMLLSELHGPRPITVAEHELDREIVLPATIFVPDGSR